MNPRIDPVFLESERISLGKADFAREFLAEFTGGGSGFFEETLFVPLWGTS
jgi:hypothetical protein